ncbi:hypothetical protein HZH68_004598 [Vespula germanica]|uniref:Odorant receptor n=1 Tax=Vespula germanica TaxID=30212 RepID=A0A834KQJ1_VESGE|nr:hypothetical protein HZH68_004598 [Vespula germanica]
METIFTTPYYRLNRLFLSTVGIWPYDDPRDSLIRKISTYIGFTMIVLSQIFALIKSDFTLRVISTIFSFLIPSLCLFTSYYTASYQVKDCLLTLDEGYVGTHELRLVLFNL